MDTISEFPRKAGSGAFVVRRVSLTGKERASKVVWLEEHRRAFLKSTQDSNFPSLWILALSAKTHGRRRLAHEGLIHRKDLVGVLTYWTLCESSRVRLTRRRQGDGAGLNWQRLSMTLLELPGSQRSGVPKHRRRDITQSKKSSEPGNKGAAWHIITE